MGLYVYKVLKKTIPLVNGERAHMAVFAYKDGPGSSKNHVRSGATRCDNAAARAQAGDQSRTSESGLQDLSLRPDRPRQGRGSSGRTEGAGARLRLQY